MVIALNKSDLNKKKKNSIDVSKLSEILACPVIETVSIKSGNNGLEQLISAVVERRGISQLGAL